MIDQIEASLAYDVPPDELSPAPKALWWLRKGGLQIGPEWERAHEICQSDEGDKAHDLVHALVHLIEGDTANAAYWYRRAGVEQDSRDPSREWTRIARMLSN